MDVAVRTIDEDDWPAVHRVVNTVFGHHGTPAHAAQEQELIPTGRVLAVVDDGAVVGTAAAYGFDLTLPGGTTVPAAGVTNVGVLPTHRRRGILRSLMDRQLADVADAGEPLAILDASEAAIYGRFGYGLASRYSCWRIPTAGTTFAVAPPDRRLRLVDQADAVQAVAAAYEAARVVRPGAVTRPGTDDRPDRWHELLLTEPETETWKVGGRFMVVVADPVGDDPGGYALYRFEEGVSGAPGMTLAVRELVAATDDTAAALWRYLLEVDLVAAVTAEVPVDGPLPWRLTDHRAVRVTEQRDYLFARVLDVPGVFAARRYATELDVVVEVHDDDRPAVAGRWRIEGGPDGARCERAEGAEPDLVAGAGALGSLVLGDVRPSLLAAAGRLEVRPTAAARQADAALVSARSPFCATRF